jgi:GNAT superfamily N-acetyltransferase
MSLIVRSITPTDRDAWLALWRDYLTFYETVLPESTTEVTWRRLFEESEPVHGLVAERDGEVVGIVHYIFHRSTWLETPACYLQDLFAKKAVRSEGVGRALIEAVYAAARAAGSTGVYWLTHRTNETAMRLYDRIAEKSGFIQYEHSL